MVGGDGGTEAGTLAPEIAPPELKPLPVQAVAQRELPVTDHEREVFCPCSTVLGETESDVVQVPGQTPEVQVPPLVGPFGWLAPVEQEGETTCPEMVSVTVRVALFCPVVVYVFCTEADEPESPSVPLQEYVYEPVPLGTEELHVTACPVYGLPGAPEQEAERAGQVMVSACQAPQLLLAFDSATEPVQEVFSLAQVRMLYEPGEEKVYEAETPAEAPGASAATVPAFSMAMVEVMALFATWMMFGKLEAAPMPMLETVPENDSAWPVVPGEGETEVLPAERSGSAEQELLFMLQVPFAQEYEQAPAYPAEQAPEEEPEAVDGRLQPLIVVAGQEFPVWLAEHEAEEPLFCPEQLHVCVAPAAGNAVVLGVPLLH